MATDKIQETLVRAMYPTAMRHLQQLLMDAEKCSKSVGKKTWFGDDKFAIGMAKFNKTLADCALALAVDGMLKTPQDGLSAIKAIDFAMSLLRKAYSSWPLGFEFWDMFYAQANEK